MKALLILLLASCAAVSAATKVVCLGDSITKRGYPEELATLLNLEVINSGVAGHNSGQGLRRMEKDVLAHQPDFVVIFFGTNDLRVDSERAHVPVAKYTENLARIIAESREAGAKVLLCTPPPIAAETYFTRHEKADYEEHGGLPALLASYRQAAMKLAKDEEIPLVDLNQLLLDKPNWLSRDGVHPSPEGNTIIARLVAKELRPLLPAEHQVPSKD
ncbi:SGNH/GDSL hydrolase family protein [Roseibacillus persicicus]|uniref:Peptidase n=1 Tax=Roseibacillus persicicus TaxID=454148 RepID=A0A918TFB6_9BACT|nr:GDSL-type esterase/lipase family protein [Roseibacillus persicicus]GHC46724.1 peptidase [Roseibacillus persicicus]